MGRKNGSTNRRKRNDSGVNRVRKSRKSLWVGWSIGLAGIIAAGSVYGSLKGDSNSDSNVNFDNPEVVIPSEISFKQVVANESISYRQKYLDELVEKEVKITPEWKGFTKVVYDPDYQIFQRDTGQDFMQDFRSNENYGKVPFDMRFKPLAVTDVTVGRESNCYVSELCFRRGIADSEDELKSLLDNEAANATMGKKGYLPLKYKVSGQTSKKVRAMSAELFSFDYQFALIHSGKRDVSKRFKDMCLSTYYPLFEQVKEISEQDDADGRLANAVIDSLKIKLSKREK